MPRSAVVLLAAVGIPVVAIAAGTALLRSAAPGELDAGEVERDVAAEYEERFGLALQLSCPDEMPMESGGVFPCRGTTGDGEDVYVEVQIADPEQDVDYHRWTPA